MASNTKTISNTLEWAKHFIGRRLSAFGPSNEPALTSANQVVQTFLQPPFKWRWNRKSISFQMVSTAAWQANHAYPLGFRIKDSNGNMQAVTSIGASPNQSGGSQPTWATSGNTTDGQLTWTESALQDYVLAIPDFGFIEKATVTDGTGKIVEIPKIQTELSLDFGTGRPHTIAPYLDDNQGNITFRFMPGVPDQAYTASVIYQKKAVLLTSLSGVAGTWPIPDEYGDIYNWGFLLFLWLYAEDARAQFANQKFMSGLLGISEGLDEQAKNIFLGQWEYLMQMQLRSEAKTQQGIAGRGQ